MFMDNHDIEHPPIKRMTEGMRMRMTVRVEEEWVIWSLGWQIDNDILHDPLMYICD